jgi:hypothetical protein
MERNVLKERLMNKDDKNRHFVLLIIDISKHGAKEMGHIKMARPKKNYEQTGTKAFIFSGITLKLWLLLPQCSLDRFSSRYFSTLVSRGFPSSVLLLLQIGQRLFCSNNNGTDDFL